jgi:hypothetical protein
MPAGKKKKSYPGNDENRSLPFEAPQNEESERLSKVRSADPVEKKSKGPVGRGEKRGGNYSVNQD